MTISFANMPSWVIVAVLSRIARHVQGAVASRLELQRDAVDAVDTAIQVAEESARYGRADERASDLAENARRVAEDASNDNQPKASYAALCAAEVARAVALTSNRQELVLAAERAQASAQQAIKPECLADFETDIEQAAQLGCGLTDSDPAPLKILDFLHCQAVHEAGHAVVCCCLRILFDRVAILPYKAGVELACNPIDHNYHLGLAAGAAAEELVFGRRREWGCDDDRRNHEKCGGTDFGGDVAEVRKYGWFSERAVRKVASLLEERCTLSDREVRQELKGLEDG